MLKLIKNMVKAIGTRRDARTVAPIFENDAETASTSLKYRIRLGDVEDQIRAWQFEHRLAEAQEDRLKMLHAAAANPSKLSTGVR